MDFAFKTLVIVQCNEMKIQDKWDVPYQFGNYWYCWKD
jgi:hypothetical protein